MSDLSIKTVINFDFLKIKHYLYLKDGSFILYGRSKIILFHKNLSWEKLEIFKDKNTSNITSMRQIKNGKILCCNNDLYIITIKSKITNFKQIKIGELSKKEDLFDVIELSDGTILGITKSYLLNIIIKEENVEIIKLYEIKKFGKKDL